MVINWLTLKVSTDKHCFAKTKIIYWISSIFTNDFQNEIIHSHTTSLSSIHYSRATESLQRFHDDAVASVVNSNATDFIRNCFHFKFHTKVIILCVLKWQPRPSSEYTVNFFKFYISVWILSFILFFVIFIPYFT